MSRLWVDANVLLRFLTGDPEAMHQEAVELMGRAERGEVEIFVSDLIVAETVWVLKSFYEKPADEIAEVLVALVCAPGIVVEDRQTLIRALELSAEKNVDFIDALLALRAAARDETVCTFDETDFRRLPADWTVPGA